VNATGVTAGPAESNGRLLVSKWRDSLHVTCGLTACTPGSAPGPTLGNEYGKTLPLLVSKFIMRTVSRTRRGSAAGGCQVAHGHNGPKTVRTRASLSHAL